MKRTKRNRKEAGGGPQKNAAAQVYRCDRKSFKARTTGWERNNILNRLKVVRTVQGETFN